MDKNLSNEPNGQNEYPEPNEQGDSNEHHEPNEHLDPNEQGEPNEPDGKAKLKAYKAVCAKLGLIMSLYYVCRTLNMYITGWVGGFTYEIGNNAVDIINMTVTIILAYIVPMIVTAIVLKSFSFYGRNGGGRALYKKPRRLARALGTFPAMYGLGYGTALLTLLAAFLLTLLTGGQTLLEDLFKPTVMEPSSSLVGALLIVFVMVVIAPIFEEFWVRGMMYDALKPYGGGMAIIISSVLFGLLHGSLYMLFYATALGFALGYVRYATGSLFVPTILHAIFNSVAAGLIFITTMNEVALDGSKLLNTVLSIYILAMLVLIVVGLIAFIKKIPVIKKYRFENEWREIGAGKKTALFFVSIPVIIMLVLAVNEHSQGWLLNLLVG